MERESVVMSVIGVVALTGLSWWLLAQRGAFGVTSGLVAALIGVLIVFGLLRRSARARAGRRLQRTDEVAELIARLATSCEDVEGLFRLRGTRLRTETRARVGAVLAAGNEVVKVWLVVADRPARLRRSERIVVQLLGELDAVRARMLNEVSIDGYAR